MAAKSEPKKAKPKVQIGTAVRIKKPLTKARKTGRAGGSYRLKD